MKGRLFEVVKPFTLNSKKSFHKSLGFGDFFSIPKICIVIKKIILRHECRNMIRLI